MAKQLNILSNNGKINSVASGGLKLSKKILIEKIEEHERFKNLYKIDEFVLERITNHMGSNGFDESQPLHIWVVTDENGVTHYYLIDGYTRLTAAKKLGLIQVPYYEHTEFISFDEAYKYVLHLQTDRRNLEGIDLLNNIKELMGSDYIQSMKNKNQAIADLIGVSKKTVERAKFVNENASEEQIESLESGNTTINQLHTEIKQDKYIEENATKEQKENLENGDISKDEVIKEIKKSKSKTKIDEDLDDISEALNDNSDSVAGIHFTRRKEDDSPKFTVPKETSLDEWTIEKNKQIESAKKDSFSEGFYKAVVFCCSEFSKGKTAEEVYNDNRISDLSPSVIYNFELPEDAEDIVAKW